ncbi:MAG: hypothetical protein L0J45_09720, partial [Psychroflexus sp.]|nr:hypothetical protein [Psychroflexus sp.]
MIDKEAHLYTLENPDGTKAFVKSHKKGKISNKDFQSLKKYLTEISNDQLNFDKNIVINYIDKDPTQASQNYQVPWDIFSGHMSDDLKAIAPTNHLWLIHKNVENLHYYHGDKINWIVDKDSLMRKSFFEYADLNGGFIIIKQTGTYFLRVGEFGKRE